MELDCNPGPLAPDDMAFMTSHPEKAPVPSLRVKLGTGGGPHHDDTAWPLSSPPCPESEVAKATGGPAVDPSQLVPFKLGVSRGPGQE